MKGWQRYQQANPGTSFGHRLVWSILNRFCFIGLRLFYRVRRWHADRVPQTGPVLLISNHQSYLDLPLISGTLPRRHFYSLARSTLFRQPLFGALIRKINAISVERGASDLRAMRQAIEALKNERMLLIFPEGSRTKDGHVNAFSAGMMLIIRQARPTIVPVAIEGGYDVWPGGQSRPSKKGAMGIMYGEPIDADVLLDMPKEQAMKQLQNQIEAMRQEVCDQLREQTNGKYPARYADSKPAKEV